MDISNKKIECKIQIATSTVLIILTIVLICITQTSCQSKKKKVIQLSKEENDFIPYILKNQLLKGANEYINPAGVEIPKEAFSKEDFNATVIITKKILEANGFKFLSNEAFNARIKNVFNRTIDTNSLNMYLYTNFLNLCDWGFNSHPNNGTEHYGTYIIKTENFITDFYYIPQLIDYQKDYPSILSIEDTFSKKRKDNNGNDLSIETWKDLEKNTDTAYNLLINRKKNIQTLIARNLYLFNDNKASVAWLQYNDRNFVKVLVKVYGYTKEPAFNRLVMDEYTAMEKGTEQLGDIIFAKNCNGKLEVREDLLKYIAENTTASDNKLVQDGLASYAYSLYYEDIDHRFTEDPSKKFTVNEKRKILAYITSVYDPLFHQYKSQSSNWNAGTLIESLIVTDPGILKAFEENKYYGILCLKEMIGIAHVHPELHPD